MCIVPCRRKQVAIKYDCFVFSCSISCSANTCRRIGMVHQTCFQKSMEFFLTMTHHQEHKVYLKGYQIYYTQRVLADRIEHSLMLLYGFNSLYRSYQTMSFAKLTTKGITDFFLVNGNNKSLKEQLWVNFYHTIFNIDRGIGLYDITAMSFFLNF